MIGDEGLELLARGAMKDGEFSGSVAVRQPAQGPGTRRNFLSKRQRLIDEDSALRGIGKPLLN
jgi:hypothetical protein